MAFPVSGILDNFNRGDADPLDGDWTQGPRSSVTDGHILVSNQVEQSAVGTCESYYDAATYGPDCEAYATAPDRYVQGVYLRIQDAGALADGYRAVQVVTATAEVYRCDNNVLTKLGADLTSAGFTNGHKFGASMIDDDLEFFTDIGAGWTSRGTRTDATYTGAGYIGLSTLSTAVYDVQIDDFGGGTLVSDVTVSANLGTLTLTGLQASVSTTVIIQANLGTLVLAGLQGVIYCEPDPTPTPTPGVAAATTIYDSATYQVKIYSNNPGELLAFYDLYGDTIQSLRYVRRVNNLGTFQFTVPLTEANDTLFQKFDLIVEIERYPYLGADAQIEMTGLTRHVERFVDDNDQGYLIVGGFSLEDLLARRVVVPADDPLAAGGYSTKDGPADDVMVELVKQQAGEDASLARQTKGLAVQPGLSAGNPVGLRLRYENLLETLMTATRQGGIDFRVERTSGAIFTFIAETIGSDLTRSTNYPGAPFVLFDPNLGNLSQPNLVYDRRSEATYIYLQGQQPDEDRETYENQSTRLIDTPYNRIEVAGDVRQTEESEVTEFLTQGATLLDEKRPGLEFSFTVDKTAQDYRTLWNLGDLVTVQWNNYSQNLRIWAVEVEIEDEETISPVVELP